MKLDALKESVWNCNHCSMCSEMVCDQAGYYKVCPVYQIKEFENYTARGHNTIALYLLEGSLTYNAELADTIYKCTTCMMCEEVCKPFGNAVAGLGGYGLKSVLDAALKPLNIAMNPIPSVAIMEAMRSDCVDEGLEPEGLKQTAKRLAATGNIYGRPVSERLVWAQGLNLTPNAATVLLVGDAAAYEAPDVARAAVKVLKQAGIAFKVLADEQNSGAVMFRTGNLALGERLVQHNLAQLMGVSEVICLSASDYYSLSTDWPKVVGALPFNVKHISTMLADLIKARRIKPAKPVKASVTYEDPCHLGRGMNTYADPRIVLKSIPGLRFIEIYPTAHAAWCCGNCGGIPESDPALALKLGKRKLPMFSATGASIITTACPEVKVHLEKVIAHAQLSYQVRDLCELVAQSLGV
jgi:heterodisulfide reductase subunit D